MSAAKRTKSADKHAISKKLVSALKKHYKTRMPKQELPILETLLYAVCLEDASLKDADCAYERLGSRFYDLNEIRVSSVSELKDVFEGMDDPEWRAARVRSILQYVFEKHFAFDFDVLRRKTLDLAAKQLAKIKYLSPFIRSYTLQAKLEAHLVPLDNKMCKAAIWLGMLPPETAPESGSAALKSAIRKADAPEFCHALRLLATDPDVGAELDSSKNAPAKNELDFSDSAERLTKLFALAKAQAKASRAKKTRKKTAAARSTQARKRPAKKKTPRKTAGRVAKSKTRKKKR